MKICIFGAGAIGGYLAAHLAQKDDVEVSVVARGEHLAAIRRNGLVIQSPHGELRARVAASDHAADLGIQDFVIVALKSHQVAPALFAPHGVMGMGIWQRWRPRAATASEADLRTTKAIKRLSLRVQDLHKHFGGVAALAGCALTAEAAATHALVGPNGSGKTTTLNVISGFVRSDRGSVTIGDRDVSKLAPHEIARLGVGRTFQTPKLLSDMTVLDNVRLGGFVSERATALEIALGLPRSQADRREGSAAAMRLLRFVGLADRSNDLAGDLPHGQQRLVEIARAMAGQPSLLLLDEPAAGLSMDELDRLGALIEAIVGLGTTVLVVEHHLELIARISRSVTVLDRGKVLAAGTPDQVLATRKSSAPTWAAKAVEAFARMSAPRLRPLASRGRHERSGAPACSSRPARRLWQRRRARGRFARGTGRRLRRTGRQQRRRQVDAAARDLRTSIATRK